MIAKLFVDHPQSVGESYFQHLRHAAGFSLQMIWGGLACLVHAILPFLFVKTGSDVIARLHETMVLNRRARANRAGNQAINCD